MELTNEEKAIPGDFIFTRLVDSLLITACMLRQRIQLTDVVSDNMKDAIKRVCSDPELLTILESERFEGKLQPVAYGKREFKAGTILTDGKGLILLTYKRQRDWSYQNVYGRKIADYWDCKFYGDIEHHYFYDKGEVPGLWLQHGYSLQKFVPIKRDFISEKVLKHFKIANV